MEALLEKARAKYTREDASLIEKAYFYARQAHTGQFRISGDAYITHPYEVALILVDMNLDAATIMAALLHDVVEDTGVKPQELADEFGQTVADIVDGVTKLSRLNFKSKEEQQAESLRKMFVATAKDVRVILVKLADRLHNVRTLDACPPEMREAVATETLDIYAPLANRLGIYQIKWELEDLSFKYLQPQAFSEIQTYINEKRAAREQYLNEVKDLLLQKLHEAEIEAEIHGRAKHFYSIYKKMLEHNYSIDQIFDLSALRILVKNVKDCYGVLGIVHTLFKPMPGRFKDYIAMPKPNMYQSLHTTVIGQNGTPFEIQIRTFEMHQTAEYGIAAHWKYKESITKTENFQTKIAWLRKVLENESENTSQEFLESVRTDLFSDEVFVFTPKGDVIDLPAGSTPVDFAYAIHSAIGNKCIGAKINGRIVNLDSPLHTGDIVEILTTGLPHGPSRDWLNFAKSSEARSKIKSWFKKELREENIVKGYDMLEKEAKRQGYSLPALLRDDWLEPLYQRYTLTSKDDLFASVGYGGLTTSQILLRLIEEYRKNNRLPRLEQQRKGKTAGKASNAVVVKGHTDMLIRFAKCCNPLPGDDIVGYITRGRGVSIHRKDCNNLSDFENERAIDVAWANAQDMNFQAAIQILSHDRSGILAEISNQIYQYSLNLQSINAQAKNGIATFNITVEIRNTEQLEELLNKLRGLRGVVEVFRLNK